MNSLSKTNKFIKLDSLVLLLAILLKREDQLAYLLIILVDTILCPRNHTIVGKVIIIINQVLRTVKIQKSMVAWFHPIKIWMRVRNRIKYFKILQICLPEGSFLVLKIYLLNQKILKQVLNQKIKILADQINNNFQKNH